MLLPAAICLPRQYREDCAAFAAQSFFLGPLTE
jgi:hypothetical protein